MPEVKEAWLTLDLSGNPLQLCIQDHGAGFDPVDNSGNPEHLGLEGMQERVKSLGGKIKDYICTRGGYDGGCPGSTARGGNSWLKRKRSK